MGQEFEEWVSVKGFEGYYEVSNCGAVRSLDRESTGPSGRRTSIKGRVLSAGLSSGRYLSVVLAKDGVRSSKYVHRLVAEAFLFDYSNDLTVDHIDRDTTNNTATNLRMATVLQQAANKNTTITSSLEFIGAILINTSINVTVEYSESFCKTYGLKKGDILRVLRKERISCGGWELSK